MHHPPPLPRGRRATHIVELKTHPIHYCPHNRVKETTLTVINTRRNTCCRAMGGGGERPIADLEARLAAAVACEDFGLAATLRDELKCGLRSNATLQQARKPLGAATHSTPLSEVPWTL